MVERRSSAKQNTKPTRIRYTKSLRLPANYTKVKESCVDGKGLFAQKDKNKFQLVVTMNKETKVSYHNK